MSTVTDPSAPQFEAPPCDVIIDTLVVGGGQADLALSEHLSHCGVLYLVLERHRIAERWRSERWDSLVANGPAWHDRFPGMEFSNVDPNAFDPRRRLPTT